MEDVDLFRLGKNGTYHGLGTSGLVEIGDHGKGAAAELAAELVEPLRVATSAPARLPPAACARFRAR